MKDAGKKRRKDPFVVRMRRRGTELLGLGRILVKEPRRFPRELARLLRRSFRTIWDARGGGLYACGYVLTFAWLEIRMLLDDLMTADSIGGFFGEQLFEMFFRYLGESFVNMLLAFLWPVGVIELYPPWGLVVLVVLFMSFGRFIKPPLERFLFGEDDETTAARTPE